MNSRFSSNLFCNETETGDKTNEVEVLNKKANLLIPFQQAPVAQWIEHRIPNPGAAGPIPAGGTSLIFII